FLKEAVKGRSPEQREALILEHLAQALRELGCRFVLPFRFRNAAGTRSTHHLVFVSKHVRAYEIMTQLMPTQSSPHDEGLPSFEYSTADASAPLLFSLQQPLTKLADALTVAFAGRTMTMLQIYNEHHVDTPFIKKNYKDALTALEEKERIDVEKHRRG